MFDEIRCASEVIMGWNATPQLPIHRGTLSPSGRAAPPV